MKKLNLFIIMILSVNIISVASTSNNSEVLAKKLAHTIHIADTLAQQQELTANQELQNFNVQLSPRLNRQLKQYKQQATQDLHVIYQSQAYKDEIFLTYVKILQETYTPQELQAMIDFYNTPMGQQVLKKQNIFKQQVNKLISDSLEDIDNVDLKEAIHGTYTSMIIEDIEKWRKKNDKK